MMAVLLAKVMHNTRSWALHASHADGELALAADKVMEAVEAPNATPTSMQGGSSHPSSLQGGSEADVPIEERACGQITANEASPSCSETLALQNRARLALCTVANRDSRIKDLLLQAAEYIDVPLHVHVCKDAPQPRESEPDETPTTVLGTAPWLMQLKEDSEVYVFDIDMHNHPALLAAKTSATKIAPKIVVYTDKHDVVRAVEPRGLKEALTSLQSTQWTVAIENEISNLESHNAFCWANRSDAGSKRIFRTTWVFKIKTLENEAANSKRSAYQRLDKYKARLAIATTGAIQGEHYSE